MKIKIEIYSFLLVSWFSTMKVLAQNYKFIVWKVVNEQTVFLSKKMIHKDSLLSTMRSKKLEAGSYVVYFGGENLENYVFPKDGSNSSYSLYEDPLIRMKMAGDSCYKEPDPLPNGKWLRIIVLSSGENEILKEKNVKDGYLDGKVEFNRTKDIEAYDSRTNLVYNEGYIVKREVFDKKGRISLKGRYGECNKIVEEKVWDNGHLWKVYFNGKVTEYDKKGKVISVSKTDPWGRY